MQRTIGRYILGAVLMACACGCGHSRPYAAAPSAARVGRDWLVALHTTFVPRTSEADSGPAALDLILARWRASTPDKVSFGSSWRGAEHSARTVMQLRDEARNLGFQSYEFKGSLDELALEIASGQPVLIKLAHSDDQSKASFVVVAGCDEKRENWLIADPREGWRTISSKHLSKMWSDANRVMIVVFPADQSILSAVSSV